MIITGTYTGSVDTDIGHIEYTVSCKADYYYDPGRMYMPNGDPGYPPEEGYDDLTLTYFDEYTVYDSDGNAIPDSPWYDEHREQIEKYISDDFSDVDAYDCDWDEPEPERDEPECYDDYEPEDN